MALTFIKRSLVPEPIRGKAGSVSVNITRMGQIRLTKLATEWMGSPKTLVMAFDNGKLYLLKPDSKIGQKVKEEDQIKVNYGKKGGNGCYFSASAILRDPQFFGEHIYNFKASGDQNFTPVQDEKNGALVVELPKGALTPRPVVARRKRNAAGTAAPANSTVGTPVNNAKQAVEEELTLDAA